jgi:hypothetical protein
MAVNSAKTPETAAQPLVWRDRWASVRARISKLRFGWPRKMIELTKDRLQEACFFLGHLQDERAKHARPNKPPLEHFRYYLNAFLSAARSVRDVLRSEENDKYHAWCGSWNAQITETDDALFTLATKMRNSSVHEGHIEMTSRTEEVPIRETYDPGFQYHRRFANWSQQQAWTIREVQYVELEGTERDVVTVCEQYIDVLTRMIDDFEKKHTVP